VETEEQLALMRQFQIDQVQGFHVGRPAPARTFQPAKAMARRPARAKPAKYL
jgi:EAL domain-containing protein (putative c-di-GMP-specific phosphodiesterase class I)